MKRKVLVNGVVYTIDSDEVYSIPQVPEDHVEYKEVDKIVRTGQGDDDFIIEKELVEVCRVPLQEYINSFANDVGIENILQKAMLPGNEALLNQHEGIYMDVPYIPRDTASQKAIIDSGKKAAADAGQTFDASGLEAMIKAAVDAAMKGMAPEDEPKGE